MVNVQEQMRPCLMKADSALNEYEFATKPMYDVVLRKWTYKRWVIDWTIDNPSGLFEMYRMVGQWVDCEEDGTFLNIGEIYQPEYYESLEDAISEIMFEVENYYT